MIHLDRETKVLIQGMTGHQGSRHTAEMIAYGTRIVGGVTPGRGGEMVHGIPVFDSVEEARGSTDALCSVMFVPSKQCLGAALEAIDAGIKLLVVVTEHLPIHDAMVLKRRAEMSEAMVVGPNSPGLAIPTVIKLGIMPNSIFRQGEVAVVSRSGTLTYEVVQSLSDNGIGQCFVAGIGGDPVIGSSMASMARMIMSHYRPRCFVLIGEIGGSEEVMAADLLAKDHDVPLVTYIAGRTAPIGKRMGHAGAIIGDGSESYVEKIASLRRSGARVCSRLSEVPSVVKEALY